MTSASTQVPERYVLDTVALVRYLTEYKKLGMRAKEVFTAAEQGHARLIISPILIAELCFWNRKHKHFADIQSVYDDLESSPWFQFITLNVKEMREFMKLESVSTIHDRIIAGHAQQLGVPLVTDDENIGEAGNVTTIW